MQKLAWNNVGCGVITGGASGIGLETARQICERRASGTSSFLSQIDLLYLCDINERLGKSVVDELNEKYSDSTRVKFVSLDVTNLDAFIELIEEEMAADSASVRLWINNAAIKLNDAVYFSMKPTQEAFDHLWKVLEVDLKAVIVGTKMATDTMAKHGLEGCIVNVSSMAGVVALPYAPIYAAAKHGVVGFTRSVGMLAPPKIRVNTFCPSFTATPFTDGLMSDASDGMKKLVRSTGPLLEVSKVAGALVDLIMDETAHGRVLRVSNESGVSVQRYPDDIGFRPVGGSSSQRGRGGSKGRAKM